MRSSRPHPARPAPRPSRGNILALAVLLMPVLIGVLGLVLDGGLLMATHRQAQNAADGGAVAAAWDKLRGRSVSTQTTTATTYVQQYNGLANATVEVNTPPASGPNSSSNYIEVIVTVPVNTLFIHMLGVARNQQVRARAVAGVEAASAGEGAIVLDPSARPGLTVGGGGNLVVNGRVVVNSQGAGYDEKGGWVDLGMQAYAASTSNGSTVQANDLQIVGGVDVPANFQNLPGSTGNPLHARALPEPDPLKELPVPFKGMAGVDTTQRGVISESGTYNPGIYNEIKLGNNTKVIFNPGIYIIKPAAKANGSPDPANGSGNISITGGAVVRGDGVMFYVTGHNFDINTGLPDSGDGEQAAPAPDGASFGSITINGSDVQLTGLLNATSPFNGMLFYQRRRDATGADIQGNGGGTKLAGTIYAKWANFKLAGSGKYDAQFVVGSIAIQGQADITLSYAGKNLGKANQVYLVE